MRLRRPSWFAVLLTVAGTLLFIRLGVWQLDRAAEKDELLRRYAASATAAQEDFAGVASNPPGDRYPRVGVTGQFVPGREYYLDDQTHASQQGIHVYAPFKVDGIADLLLVDLGFVPREAGHIPQVPPLPTGAQSLHGLYVPTPGIGIRMGGNALPTQNAWPKTTIYLDTTEIGMDLKQRMFPRVLLLDADPHAAYVRDWTPGFMPPARHRAYAFQWFTFALAAVVIFFILHRKPRRRAKGRSE
ncbi:SURF1 family protein [Pinirhizobacter soli]|uniref:SURF1 family protein n=1 Tax=Pinirhizobacter soli TaxID=2786953 RepID=UPI002545EFF2|nr:SURF1 family protein [Pinirhizobacter soli]